MNIIQVGVGGMGNTWLRAVHNSPHVDYAALVEIDEAIAAQQAERWGLVDTPIFTTLEEALNAAGADGIINVTPPQFHEAVSVTALEAGVPVLSEKPLANTFGSAQRIVDSDNVALTPTSCGNPDVARRHDSQDLVR